MGLNIDKIKRYKIPLNIIEHPEKWSFACPICIEEGADKHRSNAVLFKDGPFSCSRNSEHKKGLWKLFGEKDKDKKRTIKTSYEKVDKEDIPEHLRQFYGDDNLFEEDSLIVREILWKIK